MLLIHLYFYLGKRILQLMYQPEYFREIILINGLRVISCLLILFSFFVNKVFCQGLLQPVSDEKKLRIEAFHCTEKITVDGKLNETSWQLCKAVADFKESYPVEGKSPRYQTEVRVMYDQYNVYISAICKFGGLKNNLQVQNMSRDFSYSDNELFNIMLGTFNDPRMPVMSLSVTPYNTQLDIMYSGDGAYDYNWNALWQSKCNIQDSEWIAEIAIPFSSLRYPADATTWGINFTRNNRSTGELSGWSLWPLAFSASRLEYGGLLTNIHPPKPNLNLRLQPYALAKTSTGNNVKLQTGGEIKWAVNTNTVIDATVNTDFAQIEVDRQVINLTRSSVFFPEKRQFFLENANLFSVGQTGIIQPFFSRKIGLSDDGTILPIQAGLRIVNQNIKQSTGILLMKQSGDTLSSNPSWFNVLRYKRNVGSNFQIGAMEVMRYNEKTDKLASSFNPVSSIDFFWRATPSMYLRNMVSYSSNSQTSHTGWASLTEWNYSNNLITAGIFETIVTKGYSAQTGFTAREDFINTQPSVQLNIHKKWFPHSLAFFTPLLSADIYHTASSGQFQEATLTASPFNLVFNDLSLFSFNMYASWQNLTEGFSPLHDVIINPGNYYYTRFELSGQTNQAAHYSSGASISTGGYYNGRLNSYSIYLRAAPIPHVAVTLNYIRNDFKELGSTKKSLTTHLLIPKALVALNANIQLSGIYQYNTDAKLSAFNIRFSWQYKPIEFIYFVYSSIHYLDNLIPHENAIQNNGVAKISYIKQF